MFQQYHITTAYAVGQSLNPLYPNQSFSDISDIGLKNVTQSGQSGVGIFGSIAKFAFNNIIKPQVLELFGGGVIDNAIKIDNMIGRGTHNNTTAFHKGAGLKEFISNISNKTDNVIKQHIVPFSKKELLPFAKKELLPSLEREFIPFATKQLKQDIAPADREKMKILKNLGKKQTPKIVLSHPKMRDMDGGQLGILAGIAAQSLLPLVGNIFKTIF